MEEGILWGPGMEKLHSSLGECSQGGVVQQEKTEVGLENMVRR